MVFVTSSSDNSETIVWPWVIFGSPLGPVSEQGTLLFMLYKKLTPMRGEAI